MLPVNDLWPGSMQLVMLNPLCLDSSWLKEGDVAQFVSEVQPRTSELLGVMLQDMESSDSNLGQAALQTLGFCLYKEDVTK